MTLVPYSGFSCLFRTWGTWTLVQNLGHGERDAMQWYPDDEGEQYHDGFIEAAFVAQQTHVRFTWLLV